jgi:hypothetical protein
MAKAKTASKNDPKSRQKNKEFLYNGKKVKPLKVMYKSNSYIGAAYEDSSPVLDNSGVPMRWKLLPKTSA